MSKENESLFGAFIPGLIRYHRGLGKMPVRWKPWLTLLLVGNMIVPLFYITRLEAQVVLGVAVLNGLIFSLITGLTGFSRLLGLGHLSWIPLIVFLWLRLDQSSLDQFYRLWLQILIVANAGSVILDAANVIRYLRGDRDEMVEGL
ncbi:MAG: hypothetical protein VB853_16600 [Pirellulales bacterium]